jgi:hypothetical protein
MNASIALVAAAKKRLQDLDEEREELLSLLRRYDTSSAGEPVRREAQHAPAKHPAKPSHSKVAHRSAPSHNGSTPVKRPTTLAQQRGAKAFQKLTSGPTEIVLDVLRGAPSGLTYSEVVERALPSVQSNATNPAKSVGNVLLSLKRREKVAFHDGKYYAPLQ